MPSEKRPLTRALDLLRSQGLGVICGLSTVVLLAIGSFVIPATRDGASAAVHFDDLTAFFTEPSWVHSWLYLLVVVMVVYGVNTAYATVFNVVQKLRHGVRRISAYAPALFHLGFLVALVAHLVGGVATTEGGQLVIGPEWTELTETTEVRLVSMEIETHPTGMPRSVTGHVQLRDAAGLVWTDTVGFNDPIVTAGGVDLALLANYVPAVPAAKLKIGSRTCRLLVGASCATANGRVELGSLNGTPGDPNLAGASAVVTITPPGVGTARRALVSAARPVKLTGEIEITLEAIELYPAVLVRRRHSPGTPLALASAILLAIGVLMMGRRWLL